MLNHGGSSVVSHRNFAEFPRSFWSRSAAYIEQDKDSPQWYLVLPSAPEAQPGPVRAWEQDVEILTYAPGKPERNPMFLEKRVYQGSGGGVYQLPFIDRIACEPRAEIWKAIHIETNTSG